MKTSKSWLYLPSYLESVEWKELYKKLQGQNPVIFFFIKRSGQIEEMIVREGKEMGPEAEPLIKRGDKKIPALPLREPVLPKGTIDEILKTSNLKLSQAIPEDDSLPPEFLPPVQDVPPAPLPEMPAAPSATNELAPEKPKAPMAESEKPSAAADDGEVAVGRWVEYKKGAQVKSGKVLWISADDSEFLIKPKGESGEVVPADSLTNLLPNLD